MNTLPSPHSLPLPRVEGAAAESSPNFAPAAAPAPVARNADQVSTLRGRTVMVVDDEPGMRIMARAILGAIDYNPEVAESGEEAIAKYRAAMEANRPIDLVVMDLALPGGISGVEALGALRELDPKVKVVACSGYLEANAREAALRTGFAGVLPKPYTADRLAAVVRRALEE